MFRNNTLTCTRTHTHIHVYIDRKKETKKETEKEQDKEWKNKYGKILIIFGESRRMISDISLYYFYNFSANPKLFQNKKLNKKSERIFLIEIPISWTRLKSSLSPCSTTLLGKCETLNNLLTGSEI